MEGSGRAILVVPIEDRADPVPKAGADLVDTGRFEADRCPLDMPQIFICVIFLLYSMLGVVPGNDTDARKQRWRRTRPRHQLLRTVFTQLAQAVARPWGKKPAHCRGRELDGR